MILHTEQSILKFEDDFVIKNYKKNHMLFNEKYFNSEIEALGKLKDDPNFITISDIYHHDYGYKMPCYNFSLGAADHVDFNMVRRVLFYITIEDFFHNLDLILDGLKANNIQHRDINPGNLLFCSKERRVKLTDFFWCSNDDKMPLPVLTPSHPWPVNGKYGTDDEGAIGKIKKEINDFYFSVFQPERDITLSNFLSTVGHAPYKDGSSVFKGFAYHVVDLPQFKDEVKYHKNTCIEEYETIKKNLPIQPRSFIDIGAACGYFTFNLLRDFYIDYCMGFEADFGVNQFLKNTRHMYYLKQWEIKKVFNDSIEIKKDYDIAIWLNSHMWVYKQLGRDGALKAVSNILDHCRYMFFQTCGAYSSGMYKVAEFRCPQDIENMLLEAGGKNPKIVDTFVGSHAAPRHMFMVEGKI